MELERGRGNIEGLINALRYTNSMIAEDAAYTLGEIGDERAIEALTKALYDNASYVRTAAANALRKIGNPRINELKRRKDVEGLVKALDNNESGIRYEAVSALCEVGDERAIEPLTKALRYNDEGMRSKAAVVLGNIGDERAIEPLIKALSDGHWIVRLNACLALAKIGNVKVIPLFERVEANDPDKKVREDVKIALNALKSSDAYKRYLQSKPEFYFNITADTGFRVGTWEKLHVTIMNIGKRDAKDIEIDLSGPIEIRSVKTIPSLKLGEKKRTVIGIKPIEYGNIPLDVSISYMDENDFSFEINDVAYVNVAEESEEAPTQPQSIFNIGSIGEVLGTGAVKTGDVGMVKGGIGSAENPFSKCPYCGEVLNLPKTPKYCPYCGEELK